MVLRSMQNKGNYKYNEIKFKTNYKKFEELTQINYKTSTVWRLKSNHFQ